MFEDLIEQAILVVITAIIAGLCGFIMKMGPDLAVIKTQLAHLCNQITESKTGTAKVDKLYTDVEVLKEMVMNIEEKLANRDAEGRPIK